MQENAPQWDPMAINHFLPWQDRLLILYLLFACLFFIVRATQIALFLWRSGKAVLGTSSNTSGSHELVLASVRNTSLKHAAVLTVLLSLLTLILDIESGLRYAVTEKFWGWGILGTLTEAFRIFAAGLAVCAALYAGYALFESPLSRRKLSVQIR